MNILFVCLCILFSANALASELNGSIVFGQRPVNKNQPLKIQAVKNLKSQKFIKVGEVLDFTFFFWGLKIVEKRVSYDFTYKLEEINGRAEREPSSDRGGSTVVYSGDVSTDWSESVSPFGASEVGIWKLTVKLKDSTTSEKIEISQEIEVIP